MSKIIVYGKRTENNNETIFVNMNDFFSPFQDYKSQIRATNQINKIENSLINNKKFLEFFLYKDISLWWGVKINIRVSCWIFINFIINFSKFIEDESPEKIIVEDFQNLEIIREICLQKNIELVYSQTDYDSFKKSEKVTAENRHKVLNEKISQLIKGRCNISKEKYPEITNKILFVASSVFRRKIIDLKKKQTIEGEFIIQDIMNIIENKKDIICMDHPNRFVNTEESITKLENRMKSDMEWFPIEDLFLASNNGEHDNFLRKFEGLFNSEIIKELFQFNGISYFVQMNRRNRFLHSVIPYWLKVIDGVYDFFINNKPKSVFLLGEDSPIPLMIIRICKQLKIKTISMQHGMTTDNGPYYSNTFGNNNPYGMPIPEKALLFGEMQKQIFVQRGYPSENLTVFGNPLFFKLDKIKEYLKNKNLAKIYNINDQKKIILFFPSGFHNESLPVGKFEYDLMIWKYLLEKFSKKKDFIIILKLKHSEESRPFKELLRNYNATNFKISRDNVIEMIYLSSIVVSTISTTMIDSLCFEKPVIQVIFKEAEYKNPFDEYKVVIPSKLDELDGKILEVLNNKNICNELARNGKIFLKKNYNIPEEDTKSLLVKALG